MTDICVVVPGIGGSRLEKDRRTLWNVSDWFFVVQAARRGAAFEQLTLPRPDADDGVRATGLIKGAMVIPGFWNYGDYRPLTGALRGQFGTANVFGFAYDWRRSNAVSARLLGGFVDRLLAERPAGTRVVLVGHSMGGLVARRYLACEGGYERTRMLATIGTPYSGAASAVEAITHGLPRIPGRTGARLHAFLRSLPSVHELLPTYDCVAGDGTMTPLSEHLPDAISSTGLYPAALAYHLSTLRATSFHAGGMPPTMAVCGQRQPTRSFVRVAGGAATVLDDDTWDASGTALRGLGDGTVPRRSAQPVEWGTDPTRAHVIGGSHVDLTSEPGAQKAVVEATQGREFLALGGDDGGVSLRVGPIWREGERILVEARHATDGLRLDCHVSALHQPGVELAQQRLRDRGDGSYDTAFDAIVPGTYALRVTGRVDGAPRTVTEFVTVLPERVR